MILQITLAAKAYLSIFYAIIQTPSLHKINIRLKKFTVIDNTNNTLYLQVINKQQVQMKSCISLIKILKSKDPKVDSCGTPYLTTYKNEKVPEIQT
jgi:hypothetical protein